MTVPQSAEYLIIFGGIHSYTVGDTVLFTVTKPRVYKKICLVCARVTVTPPGSAGAAGGGAGSPARPTRRKSGNAGTHTNHNIH